jgi:hypothetical protein
MFEETFDDGLYAALTVESDALDATGIAGA